MKRALLIGIRTYPLIATKFGRPLKGCHNDVQSMQEQMRRFGFDDTRVLVDSRRQIEESALERAAKTVALRRLGDCSCVFCQGEEAHGLPSRQGIRDAVRSLAQGVAKEDVLAIYYSGHGSRFASRETFADHRFQTLVPFDSGRGAQPNRDILDWEVELWIRDLNQATDHVTLIFDSCHSGGVASTQLAGDDPETAEISRLVAPAEGEFAEMLAQPSDAEVPDWKVERLPSGWLRSNQSNRSALVLAACSARRLAGETLVEEGAVKKSYGLFTHRLAAELAEETPGSGTKWAEPFSRVAAAVTEKKSNQDPRREGNGPIFEPGRIDADDVPPVELVTLKKHALIIGINNYEVSGSDKRAFPSLETAVEDAEGVARALKTHQGYKDKNVETLINEQATKDGILNWIKRISARTGSGADHAVLIYFAGHAEIDRREESYRGCLVPSGAGRDDEDAWLPMEELREKILSEREHRLEARHVLLVLDCCFAGAFMLGRYRGSGLPRRRIYYSEYKRFVEGRAWQLLTSSSYSQQARDRDPLDKKHSPFAKALIEGLSTGRADSTRGDGRADNIVTATELHQFIDERLLAKRVQGQTPGLAPLIPTNTGEYIFSAPPFVLTPAPDPVLDESANPWLGAEPYASTRRVEQQDGTTRQEDPLFCGRRCATLRLLHRVLRDNEQMVVVQGPSGCGKTSLVNAGLKPLVENLVDGRIRMRAWVEEIGPEAGLISADDLRWVRQEWLPELAAGQDVSELLRNREQLFERLRRWAEEADLLSPAQVEALARSEELSARLGLDLGEAATDSFRAYRLGIVSLLEDPERLRWHLRIWAAAEPSLTDVLTTVQAHRLEEWEYEVREVSPEGIAGFQLPAEANGRQLLFVDRLESLVAMSETARQNALQALNRLRRTPGVKVVVALRDAAAGPLLSAFFEIAKKGESGVRRYEIASVLEIPRPEPAELAEIVEGPAGARALAWQSREVVQTIVSGHEHLTAPLPALSLLLQRVFESAWKYRWPADRDNRELRNEDLKRVLPEGSQTLIGARLKDVLDKLEREDPDGSRMAKLLAPRFAESVPQPSGWELVARTVPAEELKASSRRLGKDGAAARDHDDATRAVTLMVEERVLVEAENGLELADGESIKSWLDPQAVSRDPSLPPEEQDYETSLGGRGLPDLDRLREVSGTEAGLDGAANRRLARLLQEIRRATAKWREIAGVDPAGNLLDPAKARGLLWDRHADLPSILRLLREHELALTRREHEFIAASERRRLAGLGRELAAEATRLAPIDGSLAGLLAVQSTELAPEIPDATQALHDVLAATPLSVPLGHQYGDDSAIRPGVPGELTGMRFSADGRRLEILLHYVLRTGTAGAPDPDGAGTLKSLWACDLENLGRGFRAIEGDVTGAEGAGLTRLPPAEPEWLDEEERLARLQPAKWPLNEDVTARGALSGRAVHLMSGGAAGEQAESLHGHGLPARFQVFSGDGRWLASGATHGLGAGSSEVRVWRLGADPPSAVSRVPRRLTNAPRGRVGRVADDGSSEAVSVRNAGGLDRHALTVDGRLAATRRGANPGFWDLATVESGFETGSAPEAYPGFSALAAGPGLWVAHGEGTQRTVVDLTDRSAPLSLRVSHSGYSVEGVGSEGRVVVLSDRLYPPAALDSTYDTGGLAYAYVARDAGFVETELERHPAFFLLSRVAVSPDGALLASQPEYAKREDHYLSYGMPRVWRTADLAAPFDVPETWEDLASPAEFWKLDLGRRITQLTISSDGRWLTGLAPLHEPVLLWQIEERTLVRRWIAELFGATTLAFSPDGRSLAIGTDRGETRWVDLEHLDRSRSLERAHETAVSALAFDATGDRLATASGREVHVWTLSERGKRGYEPLVLRLGWSVGSTTQVSFSADGKSLVAQGAVGPPTAGPGEAIFWPPERQRLAVFRLDRDELVRLAWANAGRSLSNPEWHHYLPNDKPPRPFTPEDPAAAREFHRLVACGRDAG